MSCCGRNHWSAWKSAIPTKGQHSVTELQHITYSCSSFIIKGFLFCLWNVSALYRHPYLKLFTLPCCPAGCLPSFLTSLSEVRHFTSSRPGTSQPSQDSLSSHLSSCSNFIMCSFARYRHWSTWMLWPGTAVINGTGVGSGFAMLVYLGQVVAVLWLFKRSSQSADDPELVSTLSEDSEVTWSSDKPWNQMFDLTHCHIWENPA